MLAMEELTIAELRDFAKRVVSELPATAGARAHIIGLSGPLGAGKTTFVQFLAKELGVKDTVPSPTYTLVRPYTISHPPFTRLIHIDAYRLSGEEASGESAEYGRAIGWDSYAQNPENLILVEWPEHLGREKAAEIPTIHFSVVSVDKRSLKHYA